MTGALSLYLDALRVAAAFTVFLAHYGNMRISGGLLWHFSDYGHTVFLCSSCCRGSVIASVTESKERSLENYTLSRIVRLYSVMIPAFVVTAVLDWLGQAIDPTLYGPEWNRPIAHPALSYSRL